MEYKNQGVVKDYYDKKIRDKCDNDCGVEEDKRVVLSKQTF